MRKKVKNFIAGKVKKHPLYAIYDIIAVDEEFAFLLPPLSQQELERLEQSILKDGCRQPIILYGESEERALIVDGHQRYHICKKHGIEFLTIIINFNDRAHVKQWIIANQLDRRNLTTEQYQHLQDSQK